LCRPGKGNGAVSQLGKLEWSMDKNIEKRKRKIYRSRKSGGANST
jgi:hypothetical protein